MLTEAGWNDAKRTGGEQAGCAMRLLQGCHSASRVRTALQCMGLAVQNSRPSLFRECKTLSLTQQDKKLSQHRPQTLQGGDLGTHSFEGHRNALAFTDFHACTS